jgi:hypothetical protein
MEDYGDDDYDMDSSLAASKGKASSKQPAKAAGKMSDFEKIQQ